jgi:hypothetical protein
MSDTSPSPSLAHFQAQTQAAHAFQLVVSLACQPLDCFRAHQPVAVPARTFLSQLSEHAKSSNENREKTSVDGLS